VPPGHSAPTWLIWLAVQVGDLPVAPGLQKSWCIGAGSPDGCMVRLAREG
jgi:hypothetical protein